jgi:hypothetical protein
MTDEVMVIKAMIVRNTFFIPVFIKSAKILLFSYRKGKKEYFSQKY